MQTQLTGPRSIGGVLDDAVRLYRKALPAIWPLTLAMAILIGIPSIVLGLKTGGVPPTSAQSTEAIKALLTSPSSWLAYAIVTLIYMMIYNALVGMLDTVAHGDQPSLSESLRIGASRLPRVALAGLLLALAVGIGSILLLIPGIYLWGIFQLVFIPIILEKAGVFQAFGISRRLIQGYWWRTVTISSIALVMLMVVSVILGLISGVSMAFVKIFDPITLLIIRQVVGVIVSTLIGGFLPSVLLTIYYDLRLRHEGGDLAARVDALVAN